MKQYLKKFRLVYVLGLLLSLLAILILSTFVFLYDKEYPRLLDLTMVYFFSFVAFGIMDFTDHWREKNRGTEMLFGIKFRDILSSDLLFNKICFSLWLTIPNTTIYSLILRNYFSEWKYQSVAMYFVWFLFAGIFVWLMKSSWYPERGTAGAVQEKKGK